MGIFDDKDKNKDKDDLFKNLADDANAAANIIPNSLDKILKSIQEFKEEVEKEKISLSIDPVSSQKIEKILSDLENDFSKLISPVKDKIQKQMSDLFSADIKSDSTTEELNKFSDQLAEFAKKINQLSAEIGVNLGAAFENLNKDTVESLSAFAEIMAQLQQKDLKINNPFPEIIASLDEISKREKSIDSFNSVLSNILNVPVQQGTAYHLLELSDSLEIFNKTIGNSASGDINQLLNEIDKLNQKSQVFGEIADSVKGLSVIGDLAKQVSDLTTALSQLANVGQNMPTINIPVIPQPLPQGSQQQPQPQPQPLPYGPQPLPPTPSSNNHGGNPLNPGSSSGIPSGYNARNFEQIERLLARLELNNMSGAAWQDTPGHKISNEEVNTLKDALKDFKTYLQDMNAAESKFKEYNNKGSNKYDPQRAEGYLRQMNHARQQMQQANSVLVGGVSVGEHDLKNSPEEFKGVRQQVKSLQETVKNSMTDQYKLNKVFGLDEFNEELITTNRNFNEMFKNMENQPWERMSNKVGSIMSPITSGISGITGALKSGASLIGLGGLASSALSLGGLAGGITDIYQNQGRLLADARQAENLGGYGTDFQNVRDVLEEGKEYQHATNGRIQQEDYLKTYSTLVNQVRGHYGEDKDESSQDMRDLTSTATVMKGMGVSEGTTMQSITTYYKDLGLSVKETEFQLAKIAQTAQSLGVPFEDHLKAVTALASQYRQTGMEADAAGNIIGNLMFQGGMTSNEASRFAGNIGNALVGGNEGWLAYGAGMMGMDPFESVVNLKYGYNDDGTMKDGVAEQKAQILTNNYQMMSGLGGSAGQIGMAKVLENNGITDPRDVAKFLNHADDPEYLTNLFKDLDKKAGTDGITEENAKEYFTGDLSKAGQGDDTTQIGGVLGQLSEAAEQLSGIDKTLNAYNEELKDMVGNHRDFLDELTNFESQVHKYGDMLDGLFDKFEDAMDGLLAFINKFTNMDMSSMFGIGALGVGLVGGIAGGVVGKKVIGKTIKTLTGKGGKAAASAESRAAGRAGSGLIDDVERGAAKSGILKSLAKTKGGKIGLATAGIAAGVGIWDYFNGDKASGAALEEGTAAAKLASGDSLTQLDDINQTLIGIYQLLGGKFESSGSVGSISSNNNGIEHAIINQNADMTGAIIGGGVLATAAGANVLKRVRAKATPTVVESVPKTTGRGAAEVPKTTSGTGKITTGSSTKGIAETAVRDAEKSARSVTSKVVGIDTHPNFKASNLPARSTTHIKPSLLKDLGMGSSAFGKTMGKTMLKEAKGALPITALVNAGFAAKDLYDADKLNEIYGIKDSGKETANIVGNAAINTAGTVAGAAIGQTLIPIPVVGGLIGGVAGGWAADKFGDNIMDLFGRGKDDAVAQKQEQSPIYNEAQAFLERNSNAGFGETQAAYAAKAIVENSKFLMGMSQEKKDTWASAYSDAKMSGLSDKDAKEQADQLFKLNITNDDIKDLNSQQLENGLNVALITGTYQKDFEKYHSNYIKDTEAAQNILTITKEKTGLTVDSLKDLYGITETQPEKIAAALAAAIKASGIIGANGKTTLDDSNKIETIRSQLSDLGTSFENQEKAVAAYGLYSSSLKENMKSEEERNSWLKAYAAGSDPSLAGSVDDPAAYATNEINNTRRTNAIYNSTGGLIDQYKEYAKTQSKSIDDALLIPNSGSGFKNQSSSLLSTTNSLLNTKSTTESSVQLPSKFKSWSQVVDSFNDAAGLSDKDSDSFLKKSGISEEEFAKFLLTYDKNANFKGGKAAWITKNMEQNYKKADILSNEEYVDKTYDKATVAGTASSIGTTPITDEEKDKLADATNKKQEEGLGNKTQREALKQDAEMQKESEETKKAQNEEAIKTNSDLMKAAEVSSGERNKEQISALTSLQSFLGDNIKNIWNKLEDINLGVADAVKAIGAMTSTTQSSGGSSWGGGGSVDQYKNMDIRGETSLTVDQLNEWIQKKAPFGSPLVGKAQYFLDAQEESGLNAEYLIAHAAEETGWGTSNIAKTKNNYYGIGAFDSSPLLSAYGFDGQKAGIVEGAKWISKNYANAGQNTLDSMRNNNGTHEYATNPEWDENIAKIWSGAPSALPSQAKINGNGDIASYYLTNYGITTPFSPGVGLNDGWHASGHNGIDLSKPGDSDLGDNIYSIVDGKVTKVTTGQKGKTTGSGNGVVVMGSDGREYAYNHMQNDPTLKIGDSVVAGSVLGQIGSTGKSSGAHLDLKVKEDGQYIDPEQLLKTMSASSGGHNTPWLDSKTKAIVTLDDNSKKAIEENTKSTGDNTKTTDTNTDAVKTAGAANNSSTKTVGYSAVTTNIAQNDPYAGINIKDNMKNSQYVFDMYKKLNSKGLEYNDQGVNMQTFQQTARKNLDVSLKVDFSDPTNNPNFQSILSKHFTTAFNAALAEVKQQYSSDMQTQTSEIWNAINATAKSTK
ncbi:putative endo-beta-N-acetylglucosaminidase precursor [compost metagenome]